MNYEDHIDSLKKRLAEKQENLDLLKEKRAQTVSPAEVDLQLEKDIRVTEKEIRRLQTAIERAEEVAQARQVHPCSRGSLASNLVNMPNGRDFVNRKEEKRELADLNRLPFTQIYGPAGYGKTWLLAKLEEIYRKRYKWKPLWVSFSGKGSYALRESKWQIAEALVSQLGGVPETTVEETLYKVAGLAANDHEGVVLFFDSIELTTDGIQLWIEDELPSILVSTPRISKVRAFYASRYKRSPRKNRYGHLYRTYRLSPFKKADILEMLEYFIHKDETKLDDEIKLPSDLPEKYAQNILDLTSGHPKCAKFLIDWLSPHYNRVLDDRDRLCKRKELFERRVKPVIYDEILSELDPDDLTWLKEIAFFRRLTPSMIATLEQNDRLKEANVATEISRVDFVYKFVDIGLIAPPEGGPATMYEIDPVVRRVLTLELLFGDRARLADSHRLALEIYDRWISGEDDNGEPFPGSPSCEQQVAYILEALYHHCSLLQVDERDQHDCKKHLGAQLTRHIAELKSPTHEIPLFVHLDNLRDGLVSDSDLPHLIRSLAGQSVYEYLVVTIEEAARDAAKRVPRGG